MTKKHSEQTESETPAPVVYKNVHPDIAAANKAPRPMLGQRIRYRDENLVVSVADVVGHADNGTLYLHVLYRDGIAGAFNRSEIAEAVDGGPGWFYPEADQ